MMDVLKKCICAVMSLMLLAASLSGCGAAPEPVQTKPTVPENYQWATYNATQDEPFLPTDIFSRDLFLPGLIPGDVGEGYLEMTDRTDAGAYLLRGEFGKCYEVKIPAGTERVCAVKMKKDPSQRAVGEQFFHQDSNLLCDKADLTAQASFMYVCRAENEFLAICTDAQQIYIGQRTILQDTDVADNWYIPEAVGDITGSPTSLGNFMWDANTVLEKLYEPVRQRHPEYITREVIGKDQSGKYDMYAYIYAPEHYETTMFLNGGTHADEQTAYFALAKVMQLIADATPEDNLLYTLRHKVRFVVVPVLNVFGVSVTHARQNSTGADLNRDFDDLSQQESKNFMAFFDRYAKDTRILMDFHIAASSKVAVYFNFINNTDNAVANYKSTNHMYHRYMELGYAQKETDMSKVPGSYTKSDKYLEGRIWNQYGIPTITVEYVTSSGHGFPDGSSAQALTAAVETQMNFIIQNALYFLANPK